MTKYINFFLYFIISLFATVATSCSDKEDEPSNPSVAERTILVYMAANNSLGAYQNDKLDILEMREAAQNGVINKNNRLIIFWAPTDGTQTLYEMRSDGTLNPIKEYSGSEYVVTYNFMLEVFNDTKTYAPANNYGLIMWSHAMGWTQNGIVEDAVVSQTIQSEIAPKTWGEDRGRKMNITTLARVFRDSPIAWDWVYFDCCFMGSVEVAYQLRGTIPRMVSSATEIPLDGMPYEKNLPLLFLPESDLVGAAKNTFNFYNSLSGTARTCTISVFDLNDMDGLAQATRYIYERGQFTTPSEFFNLPLDLYSPHHFYDLGVFVTGLAEKFNLNSELYDSWSKAYHNVVIYQSATPMLWSTRDLSDFTGMSTYLPHTGSEGDINFSNYTDLDWYKDVANSLYNK